MRKVCSADGCELEQRSRGLCSRHYQRAKYHKMLPPREIDPVECHHCGTVFQPGTVGQPAKYCSTNCKDRAAYYRRVRPRAAESCLLCGASLDNRRTTAKYCSDRCRIKHNKRNETHLCRGCGEEIPATMHSNARFCSELCKTKTRRHTPYTLNDKEMAVLLKQDERCAVCSTAAWGRGGPQIDSYESGDVRGILCANCLTGLKHFRGSSDICYAAGEYLES